MKAKNKFSVLISVYYKEKADNLEKALYSIVNQSLMPNEIVLVEDGKLTEELYSVITSYEKRYKSIFKIVKSPKNIGLGKALNLGLKNCTNECVARMDSDDYSLENRFEKEMSIILKNDLDVVGSLIDEYDEEMNCFISQRTVPENQDEIKKYAKKRNPINHVSVIFRKSKVLEVGSYLDCPFFEDYYLWVRMLKNNCKFHNIQESLVKVRGGLDMINRRGGVGYIKSIVNFNKKVLKLGFINRWEYLKNIFIRIVVSLVPNFVRKMIYQKYLRK